MQTQHKHCYCVVITVKFTQKANINANQSLKLVPTYCNQDSFMALDKHSVDTHKGN